MDLMIFIGIAVIMVILIIVIVLTSQKKRTKLTSPPRKKHQLSLEIQPDIIVSRIFRLAPSELKPAKQEYIGQKVHIRSIFSSSKASSRGDTFREVLLAYQDDRSIHIIGEINMEDYQDQSWMTRGGKLTVEGVIKEINPKEFKFDLIKFI